MHGKPGQHEAGVHHVARRAVDVRLRRHRHQERHAIDLRRQVREDRRDPAAALPVLLERERRLHQVAGRAGDALGLLAGAGVERLAVPLLQFRLVVERVRLADAAVHEQLNDALDLGGVVQAAVELGRGFGRAGKFAGLGEQLREGEAAEPAAECARGSRVANAWSDSRQSTKRNSLVLNSTRQRFARPCLSA